LVTHWRRLRRLPVRARPPRNPRSSGGVSVYASFAKESADVSLPMLSDGMGARLTTYVEGFKIGDFDTVRAMLADEVKLDLVAKLRKQGKSEVGEYYAAYAAAKQWAYAAGVVDGRAAMLVYDREISLGTPAYFVALDFDGDRVVSIHDFLYARYAMDGVDLSPLNPKALSQ
jgi:RNA polymerase sigma-70 factor, ECF subfamily